MIVVGGGSRYQQDETFVFRAMDAIHSQTPIGRLVQGGCQGTDKLLEKWALTRGIDTATYFADWHNFGRSAGPRRNLQMLDEEMPDAVVAFPGGSGTADLVRKAQQYECKDILIIRVNKTGLIEGKNP